jgi:hypothetical protein
LEHFALDPALQCMLQYTNHAKEKARLCAWLWAVELAMQDPWWKFLSSLTWQEQLGVPFAGKCVCALLTL